MEFVLVSEKGKLFSKLGMVFISMVNLFFELKYSQSQ